MREMKFRGQSGKAYGFIRMAADAPWALQAGIALFAAQGAFGWRVVKLARLQGRLHDVQPIWAFAEAQRYGARAVFVLSETDPEVCRRTLADLEAGLSPVCAVDRRDIAIAA